MHINLDSYRVFYYVAQYRSFTKAAEMLYSNQPNVTRTIKNLEQALDCTLFSRTSRSVQLTPEGEELFSHIAPAMQQIKDGEETVLLHSKLKGGTISIGVSEIALHQVLLPVLERFRQEYPAIRLRIFNSNTQQAVSALKNRLVDFSLVTPPIEGSDIFLRRNVAAFREVPVCGKAYQHLADQHLTWEHLDSLPIISLCKGTSTHQLYSDWFRAHCLTFSPDIEAATADQILPMVRANLGIGFIPEQSAKEAAVDGSITILQLQEQPPERTISLLKRKDMPLSIAAAELERMIYHDKQNHHPALKEYFIRPKAEAPYLVADTYVKHIAAFSSAGTLNVPKAYKEIFMKRSASAKYARVPDFLVENNREANRIVCDHEIIYIQNVKQLSRYEKLAILATHTGNVSYHSFAAEVRYHAMFLNKLMKIRLPMAGSPYASAVRADMSIGDKEFQGPTPYYILSGKLVQDQEKYHSISLKE